LPQEKALRWQGLCCGQLVATKFNLTLGFQGREPDCTASTGATLFR
jgi:hypothetical protein